MIKITYECKKTNQTMTMEFEEKEEEGILDGTLEFEPAVTEDTEDPYGILSKLVNTFNPKN